MTSCHRVRMAIGDWHAASVPLRAYSIAKAWLASPAGWLCWPLRGASTPTHCHAMPYHTTRQAPLPLLSLFTWLAPNP